jgi:hypothetical protein
VLLAPGRLGRVLRGAGAHLRRGAAVGLRHGHRVSERSPYWDTPRDLCVGWC